MKRIILAALAALVLAAPAHAVSGKLLIVPGTTDPAYAGGVSPDNYAQQKRVWFNLLDRFGVDYVYAPDGKVTNVKSGSYGGERFAASLILGVAMNKQPLGQSVYWDSLTLMTPNATAGSWPDSTPTLFVGAPSNVSNGWVNAARDTTGMLGHTGGFDAARGYKSVQFLPERDSMKWVSWPSGGPVRMTLGGTGGRGPGTLRIIVGQHYGATALDRGTTACSVCDSSSLFIVTLDLASKTDTALFWARYRHTDGVPDRSAPEFFLLSGQAGNTQDMALNMMALAALDSASGFRLIGAKRPERLPMTWAPLVSWVGAHANASDFRLFLADSANFKASVGSLAGSGLHITAAVQTDSLASYPRYVAWLAPLGNRLRVVPQNTGGVAGIAGAQASLTLNHDTWGNARARRPWTGSTCATGDTSLYCMLKNQYDVLNTYFPGQVSRTVAAPPLGDMLPVTFTRAVNSFTANGTDGLGVDSLKWVLWRLGINTVVQNPYYGNALSHVSWYRSGASPSTGLSNTSDTYGWAAHQRAEPVWSPPGSASRAVVGQMRFLMSRAIEVSATVDTSAISTGHDYKNEFWWGLLTDRWYLTPLPYYQHAFDTRLSVVEVGSGNLAGSGDGYPRRPGWWVLKWMKNQQNAINYLAGRTILQDVFVEQLQP